MSPTEFAASYQSCWRTLWCVAVGVLGDRTRAEDAVQEAALIALRKLDGFDPSTSFTAWMGQIVRYVALNHARRRVREHAAHADPARLDEATTHATRHAPAPLTSRGRLLAGQDAFDDTLTAALDTLEETARACLLLRTLLDLPYREIALALSIPEGTAMSHVHRARLALRARLAPDSGPPSRAPLPIPTIPPTSPAKPPIPASPHDDPRRSA